MFGVWPKKVLKKPPAKLYLQIFDEKMTCQYFSKNIIYLSNDFQKANYFCSRCTRRVFGFRQLSKNHLFGVRP